MSSSVVTSSFKGDLILSFYHTWLHNEMKAVPPFMLHIQHILYVQISKIRIE